MRHFVEESGRYLFRSPNSRRSGKIFMIAMILSTIFPIAIMAIVYFLIPKNSFSGPEMTVFIAVLAIMIPVDIMILLFIRKKILGSGTIEINYMQGWIAFGSGSGRKQFGTGEIRKVSVGGTGGSLYGRYTVKMLTDSGQVSSISLRSREEAREVAEELASLLSAELEDETQASQSAF